MSQQKSDKASQFLFLGFLDLISCAFGAAILIFIISAASGGQESTATRKQQLMLVHARHVDGDSPEIEIEVVDPKGSRRLTTELLPQNWRTFAAPASSYGGSFLLIREPIPGDWQFRLYWTDGLIREANFELEVFCPSGVPERALRRVDLLPTKRFSEPVDFSVEKTPSENSNSARQ